MDAALTHLIVIIPPVLIIILALSFFSTLKKRDDQIYEYTEDSIENLRNRLQKKNNKNKQ